LRGLARTNVGVSNKACHFATAWPHHDGFFPKGVQSKVEGGIFWQEDYFV
jgi:hypothetical protein